MKSEHILISFLLILNTISCSFGPMYQMGMARDESALGESLSVPLQSEISDYWQVTPDIRLFHFSEGKGRSVLFVHGGPGIPPSGVYPGFTALKDSFRIHYYHQRGCGKSSRPVDRFKSENYYANTQDLVKKLGLRSQIADIERIRKILKEDKLILAGHSFGGFIAAMYAAEYPEHTEKLILISPADTLQIPPPSGGLYDAVEKNLRDENRKKQFQAYRKKLFDFGSIFNKSDNELSDLQNEFIPYYKEAAENAGYNPSTSSGDPSMTGGWMQMGIYFDMGNQSDFRDYLKKITAPTLIIYGKKDFLPDAAVREYQKITDSRTVIAENAGHFPFTESPEDFAVAFRNFTEK